ncbi:defensin, isoforms B and C-like [Diabrotica virgifera virgifera]|uniref:Defensin, isoforms B and C-like n=1 Tax=Diabrotica virgifera virgifera TaxID=50390 RepID=A0A6P7GJT1_DIAVI|nr:defensin, isoforms B and C-like [Diabrotica virgifera virgifera]
MKIAIALFLCVLVANVLSAPSPIEEVEESGHVRVKRFTCDVIGSISYAKFKLNDAACAAHCRLKHRPGGWCDQTKQCHCR